MHTENHTPTIDEVKNTEWESPDTFRKDGILYRVNYDFSIVEVKENILVG